MKCILMYMVPIAVTQPCSNDDHVDYLHDGHLHHVEANRVYEHEIPSAELIRTGHADTRLRRARKRPYARTQLRSRSSSTWRSCGLPGEGHLHHPHGDHCDDHSALKMKGCIRYEAIASYATTMRHSMVARRR